MYAAKQVELRSGCRWIQCLNSYSAGGAKSWNGPKEQHDTGPILVKKSLSANRDHEYSGIGKLALDHYSAVKKHT